MPCWDHVGEEHVLRRLTENKLVAGTESNLFQFPELLHIRRSFMENEAPYSDFCDKCAVRGLSGVQPDLKPDIMEILQIESSFLCHLACPQCIPPKLRGSLRSPPYNMSAAFFRGLLQQLKNEGVKNIRVIHFEGRGDPLANPHLGQMIGIAKECYPTSFTSVTTHGSYPYKPWILTSGLDLLRVSVDGAFQRNYEKYRVGGKLQRILKMLRQLRDERRRLGSTLQLEWKYILFEWNDSDAEIRHASKLAEELEIQLSFLLTHSMGKSIRFSSPEASAKLKFLAPAATLNKTEQLRTGAEREADVSVLLDQYPQKEKGRNVWSFLKRLLTY